MIRSPIVHRPRHPSGTTGGIQDGMEHLVAAPSLCLGFAYKRHRD